eukprot:gene13911-18653_t
MYLLTCFCVIFFSLAGISCTSFYSNISQSEYFALQCFYVNLNGSSWDWQFKPASFAAWDFSGVHNPCEESWYGLICSSSNENNEVYVTNITLTSFNLRGIIPNCVANLTRLTHLDLSFNSISGSLPYSLNSLKSLQSLILNSNLITGTFPMNILKSFQQLKCLYLYENIAISGTISNEINSLSNLQLLSLQSMNLTGKIPIEIYELSQLTELLLCCNHFTGIISSNISNLNQLIFVDFGKNQLTGSIPNSIENLNNLISLDLFGNLLTGSLPSSMNNLTNLNDIFLQNNYLTGFIPNKFFQILTLYEVNLYENYLSGEIPSFYNSNNDNKINYYNMKYLQLQNNYFSGSLPSSIGLLTNLTGFRIQNNIFSNKIPNEIYQNLRKLNYFYVYNNYFSGTIDSSIENLQSLISLQLFSNLFSKSIPYNINYLYNLEVLFLHNNHFTNNLYNFIDVLKQIKLRNIDVSDNQFTGTIPYQLFSLPNIQSFAAVSNCFNRAIKSDICNSTTLNLLSLDGLSTASSCRNYILPQIISNAYTLTNQNNNYDNTIPLCIFAMKNIQTLHLSGNNLMGSLPNTFEISLTLNDLILSHNTLTGTIPTIIQERIWYNLDLSNNKLTGLLSSNNIPLIKINSSFDVEINRLSGIIPNVIVNAINISVLRGNLFGCDIFTRDMLPTHDPYYNIYDCGSNSFNQ